MRAAAQRLSARLGRRGKPLVLLGLAKVSFGLGYALHPTPNPLGLELLARFAPLRYWSSVWIICGAVTFACAWLRVGRDGLGFFTGLVPPFFWGAAYLWGGITGEYVRGLAYAAWFLFGHVLLILWMTTVPEHSVPHPVPRKARR